MARGIVELLGEDIILRIERGREQRIEFAEAAENSPAGPKRYDKAVDTRERGCADQYRRRDVRLARRLRRREWAGRATGDRELDIRVEGRRERR